MTDTAIGAAPLPRPSAFAGTAIADLAGLRWDPAVPQPRFESGTWLLDGWADASVQMSRAEKRWEFTRIRNPAWQCVARELAAAWLAPHHEEVASLARAWRTPRHPRTCYSRLFHLTAWLNWLTDRGITTLGAVTQHECDAFIADYSEILDKAGQPVRRKNARSMITPVSAMKDIADYGDLLSADRYQPGFEPWPGQSPGKVAGAPIRPGHVTQPLPDEVLRPLLTACLYLVQTIGPHALELTDLVSRDRRRAAGMPRLVLPDRKLRAAVKRMLARDYTGPGRPLPEAPGSIAIRRTRLRGWDETDPLLRVSLASLARRIGLVRFATKDLPLIRDLVEAAVAAVGTAPPWGRDAAPVARSGDGTLVPWTTPVHSTQVDSLVGILQTACQVTITAFTGMRSSELLELLPGCRMPPEETAPGLFRYRIAGKVVKSREWGGERDEWVVIEQAYQAVGLAEQLTAGAPGRSLFSRYTSSGFRDPYETLRRWVNSPAGERLGLEPIPDYPVNPRAVRRTLALELAARPGGIIAAKVALKHISVTTTEGYAARPGGAQSVFHAEWKAEEAKENLRLTVEAFRQFQQGQMPSGPGAARLADAFRSVEEALNGHDPGPARTTSTDRQVELLLKARSGTLHQSAANYCWFDDPAQALCLKLAGIATAKAPLAGMCDSSRCPQATHHPRHRAVWASAAEATAVMLASPRVPSAEKQRLRLDHDRALKVIEAIDGARPAGPGEG